MKLFTDLPPFLFSIVLLFLGRFMLTVSILCVFTTWTLLWPPAVLMEWLELETMPFGFRLQLLSLAVVNFGLCWLGEKSFFAWITRSSTAFLHRCHRGPTKPSSSVEYHTLDTNTAAHQKPFERIAQQMGC
ncbi:hypothetical protein DM01DRAFT_1129624 [Hesseltinella vesiculosa]|uniref:Uncharacterized protein n=1 Tax=Hesseltinella vesiculosa TaxID=101127 RepID=A0A1X2GUV8_9FUNG|nr:hypothetical protein DM01DRAFT_1129624 [Hesseltinella vesiculosa]